MADIYYCSHCKKRLSPNDLQPWQYAYSWRWYKELVMSVLIMGGIMALGYFIGKVIEHG